MSDSLNTVCHVSCKSRYALRQDKINLAVFTILYHSIQLCAVVHLPDLSELSQAGAEGSEIFDGFTLLTEEDARRILKQGTDDHGSYYPMVTWAAMTYFVTGLWRQ